MPLVAMTTSHSLLIPFYYSRLTQFTSVLKIDYSCYTHISTYTPVLITFDHYVFFFISTLFSLYNSTPLYLQWLSLAFILIVPLIVYLYQIHCILRSCLVMIRTQVYSYICELWNFPYILGFWFVKQFRSTWLD